MTLRTAFDLDLHRLQDEVLKLGARVEEALLTSVEALRTRDLDASQRLVAADRAIDELRYRIEADALTVIALQQPTAGDLRTLAAVLFIANELERIGDYGKGIGRVNLKIGAEELMKPLIDIPRMAEIAQKMVHESLRAFIHRNVQLAESVIALDDQVDSLYDQIYSELITLLFADVSRIRQANMLLMAAHNLERAADRATNICERVIYCVTGELLDAGWEEDVA
jgi:phosphate transport system protein